MSNEIDKPMQTAVGLAALLLSLAALAGCIADSSPITFNFQVANTTEDEHLVDVVIQSVDGQVILERDYQMAAHTKTTMETLLSPGRSLQVSASSGSLHTEQRLDIEEGPLSLLVRIDASITIQLGVSGQR